MIGDVERIVAQVPDWAGAASLRIGSLAGGWRFFFPVRSKVTRRVRLS
jgi:hypothetical protein